MKNLLRKSAGLALSVSLVMSGSVIAHAEEESGSMLDSLMGYAQQVWSNMSDETKESLTGKVQELFQNEEIQEYIQNFLSNLPEEAQSSLMQLAAAAGGADGAAAALTHDDVLEQTGLDLPGSGAAEAVYLMSTTDDGTNLASVLYDSGDFSIWLYEANVGEKALDEALSYFPVFQIDQAEAVTVNGYDGYFYYSEEEGTYANAQIAWLNTDTGIIYEASVVDNTNPDGADAQSVIALMESETTQQ